MKRVTGIFYWIGISLLALSLFFQPNFFGTAQENNPDSPQDEFRVYIPFVHKPVQPTIDLSISALEITQAIQGLNNHVNLVQSRPTTVRVYARFNEAAPLANVSVALAGSRNGVALPGSPLISSASKAYPLSANPNDLRGDINKSFNFQLPSSWLSGQVTLEAFVDQDYSYWEADENNNTFSSVVNFQSVPTLNIKIVPIKYTDTYYQKTFQFTEAQLNTQIAEIKNTLLKIYPVSNINIQKRTSAINFTGDLGNYYYPVDWDRLLNKIVVTKNSDGSPASEVYYGLIPFLDDSGNSWWFYGILGYGYVGPPTSGGPRAAIGLGSGYVKAIKYTAKGDVTAAHEIGHNLGRLHAPCGKPGDLDQNYPYSEGSIGQFGLDAAQLKVYSPAIYTDIMGYCDNVWISDYNYSALMYSQIHFGATSAQANQPQKSLVLSGQINPDGEVSINPAYVLTTQPDKEPDSSDFTAQFLDANGNIISSHPLAVSLALSEKFSTNSIQSVLPLPSQKPTSLRIFKNQDLIFEKRFIEKYQDIPISGKPQASLQAGSALKLQWSLSETISSILRYSTDGGLTWVTLDVNNQTGTWVGSLDDLPEESLLFQVIPAWSLEPIIFSWSPDDIR